MLLYQGYREWDPLPLHWGALVDLNGEPTERYHEAARLNRIVQAHERLFLEAQPAQAQVGLLVDQRNAIATVGMGAGEMLLRAIKGAYRAYWAHSYPVEFITPELLAAGRGQHYRLLLLPFLMLVTPACAEALAHFVAAGGTLVAFAKCGMLNEKSWLWHDRPGGLTELFGVKETHLAKSDDTLLLPEPGLGLFKGVAGPLPGYWHRQDFALAEGAHLLARYEDGAPAVTLNHYGQGRAILFGTHFDAAALPAEATDHRRVLANLAELAGIERPFQMEAPALVDGHLLTHDDERLFIIANHGPNGAEAQVALPGIPAAATVTDLFAGKRLETKFDLNTLIVPLRLDGYDSTMLLIR
jgi:hypothetical protein